MKRTFLFILVVIMTLAVSVAKEKTTLEKLINKEWYEMDSTLVDIIDTSYVRYTGTQRLIVSADKDGNNKIKIQKYYLSNKWEYKFDSTKVGKNRKGKYIIIRGELIDNNEYNVLCHEITNLTETKLHIKDTNHPDLKRSYYKTIGENQNKKEGKFVSTVELLANKLWFMLDENGNRKRIEWSFDDGSCYKCKLPDNRYTEFPKWERREFYLSNEIVTKFNRKQVGKSKNGLYLVINDQEEDGEWQVRTYDIKTLSADRLMLECIYPGGEKNLIFESQQSQKEEQVSKLKPQQKNLMTHNWYRVDTIGWKRTKYIETFTKTHVTRSFPARKDGELIEKKVTFEYYMSNQPVAEFDWSQKGKNPEGDYIVVNEPDGKGNYRAVNYLIMSLEGSNMFTMNVSHPDSILHVYDRDKTAEETSLARLVTVDSIGVRKSMVSMVVGKQFYWVEDGEKDMSFPRYYYNEIDFAAPRWKKTKKGYKCEILTSNWCFSNSSWSTIPGLKDGKYLIHYKYGPVYFNIYPLRILRITDTKIITQAARDPDRLIEFVNE